MCLTDVVLVSYHVQNV